jgi:nucleoid-associated protein YgaU
MFKKGSRYEKAVLFKALPDGTVAFEGLRPRAIGPSKGVIKHTIKAGDRLDLLARHYYNDDKLWWRIVDTNPEFLYAGKMTLEEMEGKAIFIPKARE